MAFAAMFGITVNTAAIASLEETIRAASSLLEAAELLKRRTADIADAVAGPPGRT